MPINDEGMLGNNQAKKILQNIIEDGRAGVFSWDIDNRKFVLMEKITGREFENIQTLEEFIHQLVFEKDLELALQDLDDFMTGKSALYQSTFRIINKYGNVRWLLCKGSMMPGKILSTMMYDVTEGNLIQGHDLTTNLMDKTTFMRKLKIHIRHLNKHNQKSALLYIGIDNFNMILNKYGFELGSSILYKISRQLLKFVSDKDELARFPYNKFMLQMNDVDDYSDVEAIAREISTLFETPIEVEGQNVFLNVNIGLTLIPDVSSDVDELMRICDFAIDRSRVSGSHAAVFNDSDWLNTYNRTMEIANELPKAILNDEFYLVYQPQLDLKANAITGIEVLVRWKSKNLGQISPAEFIPIAETNGYIVTLGRWIREESLKTARGWLDKAIDFEKISINISAEEVFQDDFKERLLKLCQQYNIEPQMVVLEITERTFMNTNGDDCNIISELLNEGFKIALDDFGIGYSNICSLLEFDIHTLKIDKSFIDKSREPRLHNLLKGILKSKNYLYTYIIAEGVEDEGTVDVLNELGFDSIQGYYFSKPLLQHDLENFILDFNSAKINAVY